MFIGIVCLVPKLHSKIKLPGTITNYAPSFQYETFHIKPYIIANGAFQ